MDEDLATQSIDLPSGPLSLLQPVESAELPDDGPVEWAPIAPYWSVLWRSGVALARAVDAGFGDGRAPTGLRVIELGCGLGLPSIAAARAGAAVLATDQWPEALALLERNARLNDVELGTAALDWASADLPASHARFDLVLASDVLYEDSHPGLLLALLPRLAPEVWLADPGRPAADDFLDRAADTWEIETTLDDVVRVHRLRAEQVCRP